MTCKQGGGAAGPARRWSESGMPTILLADIGGTNARFAYLRPAGLDAPQRVPTSASPSIEAALTRFLAGSSAPPPDMLVIAGAGPVRDRRIAMSNAAWIIDAAEIARATGIARVELVNDFAAQAWALPDLPAPALVAIGGTARAGARHAPLAVMGPGTGFGLALLAGTGAQEQVVVTEGGHATLAAHSEAEADVLAALRARLGRVSVERVMSGPGLVALHGELARRAGLVPPPGLQASGIIDAALAAEARAAAGPDARAPEETLAVQAVSMFCGWLGSVAGDIVLTTGATGGVYLAGGVSLHLAAHLGRSAFRGRFEDKGRMAALLREVPVFAITHPDPAFLGLARLARSRLGPSPGH